MQNSDAGDSDRTETDDAPDGAREGIGICETNPYYWTYDGEPTLLLGGSPKDNLYQHVGNPDLDVERALNALLECGGNYVRHTMQSRVNPGDERFVVQPFGTHADGRYDLETWNPEYWKRFRTVLDWTAERDIVMQVTFWDRFDFTDHGTDNWSDVNPWNPANNVTYAADETGLPTAWDRHPAEVVFPFMLSVEEGRRTLLDHQERFVGRVLDYALPYDHVLYNVSNETRAPKSWGDHWATFARERAAARDASPVYVTQMYDDWDVTAEMHDRTHEDPDTYDYVDVSQNNQQSGRTHYENLIAVRSEFADRPWPLNNVKCYGSDGGPHGNTQEGLRRFWRGIFGGSASMRFHRPDAGLGIGELAKTHLRAAREVTDELELATTEPRPELLDGREPDEAYCLSDGSTYLVFFASGGTVALDADLSPSARIAWYDVSNARWTSETSASSGRENLSTPGRGYWVAIVSE